MKRFLFLLTVVFLLGCKAQIQFSDTGTRYKESLLGLYNHFKEKPTDTAALKDTSGRLFRFYDEAVSEYFNKTELSKAFERFGYSPLLQYEVLRGIDIRIDSLKSDSIFVMSGKQFQSKYGGDIGQNMEKPGRFIAGTLQAKGPPRALLDISFDGNGKFIYIAPIIHFQ